MFCRRAAILALWIDRLIHRDFYKKEHAMFPSWTGKMIFRLGLLAGVTVSILGGVWMASGGFGTKTEPSTPGQQVVSNASDDVKGSAQ
jgi:hypothetical protein